MYSYEYNRNSNLAGERINQWGMYRKAIAVVKSSVSRLLAHSSPTVPDVNVVGYTQQRSFIKDPCSLEAKEAIIEKTGELCSGMDSLSVALKFQQKHLPSDNDLDAVRDFQEVKEGKNSRLLQSVKNAITATGVQGFQDVLSILGKFQLLHSVVIHLQALEHKFTI